LQIFEFVIQKFYALRKPKTNIQILQQSVLLKYKYVILSYHIPIWLVVSTSILVLLPVLQCKVL